MTAIEYPPGGDFVRRRTGPGGQCRDFHRRRFILAQQHRRHRRFTRLFAPGGYGPDHPLVENATTSASPTTS